MTLLNYYLQHLIGKHFKFYLTLWSLIFVQAFWFYGHFSEKLWFRKYPTFATEIIFYWRRYCDHSALHSDTSGYLRMQSPYYPIENVEKRMNSNDGIDYVTLSRWYTNKNKPMKMGRGGWLLLLSLWWKFLWCYSCAVFTIDMVHSCLYPNATKLQSQCRH